MHFEYTLLSIVSQVLSYGMVGGAGYLAWRLVRAYERRAAAPEALDALTTRLQLLEESLEDVARCLGETVEAQRFTTLMLAGQGSERHVGQHLHQR